MAKYLENTYYKLAYESKLNVAYFGGSITFGAAASDKDKTSWRALTTSFLRECFKEAQITEINAAISGTGTGYALFRIDDDLLKFNPDLVFVEFSMNDIYQMYTVEESLVYYESVLKRIYAHNPNADIVMVITTDKGYINIDSDMMRSHIELAGYYGLPVINVGEALREELEKTGNSVDEYIADWVHPADKGYAVYAKTVCAFLEKAFADDMPADIVAKNLPENYSKGLMLGKTMRITPDKADNLVTKGIALEGSFWGDINKMQASNNAGDEWSFTFSGTYLGAWIETSPEGVAAKNMVAIIDGETYGPLPCTKQDHSLIHITCAKDLKDGLHKVTLKNLSGGKFRLSKLFMA